MWPSQGHQQGEVGGGDHYSLVMTTPPLLAPLPPPPADDSHHCGVISSPYTLLIPVSTLYAFVRRAVFLLSSCCTSSRVQLAFSFVRLFLFLQKPSLFIKLSLLHPPLIAAFLLRKAVLPPPAPPSTQGCLSPLSCCPS